MALDTAVYRVGYRSLLSLLADECNAGWLRRCAGRRNPIAANLAAIASLSLTSLLVVQVTGPPRSARWCCCGCCPSSQACSWVVADTGRPYFLSGPLRAKPRYRATIPAMTLSSRWSPPSRSPIA